RWLGYQGALFAVASLIGPLAGGFFVDQFSWRWAFYVNLPLAAVSAFVVLTEFHPPKRRVEHAIDYAGAALLTASLGMIVLLVSVGGRTVAWLSPETVALGAVAVLSLVLLVVRERRA